MSQGAARLRQDPQTYTVASTGAERAPKIFSRGHRKPERLPWETASNDRPPTAGGGSTSAGLRLDKSRSRESQPRLATAIGGDVIATSQRRPHICQRPDCSVRRCNLTRTRRHGALSCSSLAFAGKSFGALKCAMSASSLTSNADPSLRRLRAAVGAPNGTPYDDSNRNNRGRGADDRSPPWSYHPSRNRRTGARAERRTARRPACGRRCAPPVLIWFLERPALSLSAPRRRGPAAGS